jgi:ferredoxin-NADP reductase
LAGKIDDQHFSLFVDIKPGGPGSQYFKALKPGDTISYIGPFGTFAFRENDGAQNLLFLGTGSGLSPLKCMIEDALENRKLLFQFIYI